MPAFHPQNDPVKQKRGRGRPKKDPFEDLSRDWKEKFSCAPDDSVRSESSAVALAEVANQAAKTLDQDLAEKVLAAKEAGMQYAEATKTNKLKLKFLRQLLEMRGKEEDISLRADAG